MTETITFKNVYMTYIENNAYKYPSIDVETILQGYSVHHEFIDTGWHIIPNFLWRHVITPKQWAALVTGCESYCVKGIRGVIYNPIPITTNIAIQRTNVFSAFNNCTYAMTYTDDKYETQWYKWYDLPRYKQLHLALKEGVIWNGTGSTQGGEDGMEDGTHPIDYTPHRYSWPIYHWQRPQVHTIFDNVWSQGKYANAGVFDTDATTEANLANRTYAMPGGIFWDPLNCAEEIGELRAGKNSTSFNFTPSGNDADKYFNLDVMASFAQWSTDGPFCGIGRPGQWKTTTNMDPNVSCTWGLADKTATAGGGNVTDYDDYTIPNMYNMPIMPTKWFWIEIGKSIIDSSEENEPNNTNFTHFKRWRKANKYWPGTEWEAAHHPPCQWFCKGIPLYDATNSLIRTTTQCSFQIEITLEGKKRRSAYFAPTHGPWSGDQLYYHTNQRGILQPACVRYKTGGVRRTWQNIQAQLLTKDKKNDDVQRRQQNAANLKKHPREDVYLWDPDAANLQALYYPATHRPVGIPETGRTTNIAQKYDSIRVTWTRDTDSTEIHME